MRTLLLDRERWDLVKDAAGNIALAQNPYAVTQDASSALRLFSGELYFDSTKGLPYFQQILGTPLSLSVVRSRMADAVLEVPDVANVRIVFSVGNERELSGQAQITLTDGTQLITEFTNA